MRKRVTRWYREVNEIDHVLATGTPEEAKAAAERLREVQAKLARIPPPPTGLMGELYDLKQHVEWLLRPADTQAAARHSPRLISRVRGCSPTSPPAPSPHTSPYSRPLLRPAYPPPSYSSLPTILPLP